MTETKRPGKGFWIVAAVFLLWNVFGCLMYMFDKLASEEALLAMENGTALLAAREAYPLWATAAYAVAVWGGLLAAVMVLLRKKLALSLFVISIITAAICFVPTFTMTDVQAAGGSTYWLMPVIVIIIGMYEIRWSKRQAALGLLS